MRNYKIVSIVDDDESIRTSTASLVRSMGWEARVYESADEFLKSIVTTGLGCIVCDVQMPGMTGLQMLDRLREGKYSFTMIFVTAYFSEALDRKATTGGALCVLEKPVDPSLLCDWLARALGDEE